MNKQKINEISESLDRMGYPGEDILNYVIKILREAKAEATASFCKTLDDFDIEEAWNRFVVESMHGFRSSGELEMEFKEWWQREEINLSREIAYSIFIAKLFSKWLIKMELRSKLEENGNK